MTNHNHTAEQANSQAPLQGAGYEPAAVNKLRAAIKFDCVDDASKLVELSTEWKRKYLATPWVEQPALARDGLSEILSLLQENLNYYSEILGGVVDERP